MKLTNAVAPAKWCKVDLTSRPNHTTNSCITPKMEKRELFELNNGSLVVEHDMYLGERA